MASPTATQAPQTPISRKPIATASQDPIPAVFQEPQTDKMAAEQQAKQIALLNYKDYANGDPVEVIYNSVSRTFDFKARSQLVHDENEILDGRAIVPIPRWARKMKVKVSADQWEFGALEREVELPAKVIAGRQSGMMFRALFVDGRV